MALCSILDWGWLKGDWGRTLKNQYLGGVLNAWVSQVVSGDSIPGRGT